jgi:hypothetical protein
MSNALEGVLGIGSEPIRADSYSHRIEVHHALDEPDKVRARSIDYAHVSKCGAFATVGLSAASSSACPASFGSEHRAALDS